MSFLIKVFFLDITSFRVNFRVFLGFSMVRFQLMFLKISSINTIFQDLSNDVFYVCVTQKFIFSTCLTIMEKDGKMWKSMKIVLSAML